MSDTHPITPPIRPEIIRTPRYDAASLGEVRRQLSFGERVANVTALRRLLILVALAAAWQLYAQHLNNALMFPTFASTVRALFDAIFNGELLSYIWTSIKVLLLGYAVGVALAVVLTTLSVSSRLGGDLLTTLTAMFNPLPAIALLPMALLWFGLGTGSLIFVIVHSVLWTVALNMYSGFNSVAESLRLTGRNCGLTGFRYVAQILIPAAFPSILAGLKIGWAFAWRALIAAELVFGVSSGSGGLGWYIFKNKSDLDIPYVFAGLGVIIIIGLLVDNVAFRGIEARTVQRWGMQH